MWNSVSTFFKGLGGSVVFKIIKSLHAGMGKDVAMTCLLMILTVIVLQLIALVYASHMLYHKSLIPNGLHPRGKHFSISMELIKKQH
jgi:hypothetical protein